jgi:hypothetical protein
MNVKLVNEEFLVKSNGDTLIFTPIKKFVFIKDNSEAIIADLIKYIFKLNND